jgi:hypothetical protein
LLLETTKSKLVDQFFSAILKPMLKLVFNFKHTHEKFLVGLEVVLKKVGGALQSDASANLMLQE